MSPKLTVIKTHCSVVFAQLFNSFRSLQFIFGFDSLWAADCKFDCRALFSFIVGVKMCTSAHEHRRTYAQGRMHKLFQHHQQQQQ